MRVLRFALVVLAGCRFGFDDLPPRGDSRSVDAHLVDVPPGHCGATKIANYDLGATGMTDIAAAKVADGYAVGTTTSDSILFGVHLDNQLVANAATPFQTTPATGYPGHYSNGSLYFDGTNLAGSLSVTDGTCFLKVVSADMTGFGPYMSRTGQVGEPSIANANGTALRSFWYHDDVIQYVALLADGSPDTADQIFTSGGATITGVSVADGPSAYIVWSDSNGNCGLGAQAAGVGTSMQTLASGCTSPFIYGNGAAAFATYVSGPYIEVEQLGVDAAAMLSRTTAQTMGTGTDPRTLEMGSGWWVAFRDSSRLHLEHIASHVDTSIDNVPSGPPDAYEPAGPYLFAVWGSELWAITCP